MYEGIFPLGSLVFPRFFRNFGIATAISFDYSLRMDCVTIRISGFQTTGVLHVYIYVLVCLCEIVLRRIFQFFMIASDKCLKM